MKALFCMAFGKKTEWIGLSDSLVAKPLGDTLITVLSTDFSGFLQEIEKCNTPEQSIILADKIRNAISLIHPILENYLIPVGIEEHPISALKQRLETLDHFQSILKPLAEAVFLEDDSRLSSKQKFCRLISDDRQTAALFVKMSEGIKAEQSIYVNHKHFQPLWDHLTEKDLHKDITFQTVYGSDDLLAILFTEMQEMAAQNLRLKRCAYCGRYFVPFSSKSIYCDRFVGNTGKTCQELAAKEKHEKKVAGNEGLALYRKRNKAYAMRVSRAPAIYTDAEYQIWKTNAENALKAYLDGDMDLSLLNMCLELPLKK